MNTLQRNFALLLLLACSVLFLPACGGGNVQSNKAPETVLNTEPTPDSTPVSSGTSSDNTSVNTYVEKSYVSHIKRSKGPNSTTTITTTPTDATPVVTAVVAQQNTPVAETPKKSGGSHWFLWLLVVLVLLGIGWYFWAKNQEDDFGQPKAPTGGLSPVSGFTAVKDQIEEEAKSAPSIWTKKLF